jgi:hypothetical protein
MAATFRVYSNSLQERFAKSRKKVQIFGGGFANGKTANSVVQKILPIAKDYPGAEILVARSTYPKLNDTIRKEFLKWCPPQWIKSFPRSANSSNTCTLVNGTTISFRYIQQQGKNEESSTSNLLSATYDLIVVDQMEDPEIVEKDFLDLLGRLRGNAEYIGDDPTMPKTGPRWICLTLNPTRNWCYKKLIKPLHHYLKTGVVTDELLCRRNTDNHLPTLDSAGKPQLLIELFEGSTYENKENLGEDFIQALESSYRGQMRDRFLLGLWGAYEGLIYPEFEETTHMVSRQVAERYLDSIRNKGYEISWLEGYDYGLAAESCYLHSFVDPYGNIIILDGFYRKEYMIGKQVEEIRSIRNKYDSPVDGNIDADPAIFRRGPGGTNLIGRTVADILWDYGDGIRVRRGNNAIINGITKVQEYLSLMKMHKNPFTNEYGAPHVYVVDDMEFIAEEFNSYMWNSNNQSGDKEDKPKLGQKDHAMDTIKYMLSRRPKISKLNPHPLPKRNDYSQWQEYDDDVQQMSAHRYG